MYGSDAIGGKALGLTEGCGAWVDAPPTTSASTTANIKNHAAAVMTPLTKTLNAFTAAV